MPSCRQRLHVLVLAAALSGCGGNPPDKEMQQAQGALDAARAAGAEQYAREEYTAAQDALKRAQDAVADRDYRLAFNHALDARERAQAAARQTADHKAAARVEADRALRDATATLAQARAKLRTAELARVPARTLSRPRQTISEAEQNVQKARAAFQQGDYLTVLDPLAASTLGLTDAVHELEAATASASRRRR